MDIFTITMSILMGLTFGYILWFAYSMIQIHNGDDK